MKRVEAATKRIFAKIVESEEVCVNLGLLVYLHFLRDCQQLLPQLVISRNKIPS